MYPLFESIKIQTNFPLVDFDTAQMMVLEDTTQTRIQPTYKIDSTNNRQLIVDYNWKEGIPYSFQFLPNALNDMYQLGHDSILLNLVGKQTKEFGNINLTITDLDTSLHYVIELGASGGAVKHSFSVTDLSEFKQSIQKLEPAAYQIRIISDLNQNGKWDTGNYRQKIQPEPLFLKKLERLRANWDLEVSFSRLEENIAFKNTPKK